MSDASGYDGTWEFSPDSDTHLVPFEPYDERVLQFQALEGLGYPVELREVPVGELEGLHPNNVYVTWKKQHYPVWARPVVTDPRFDHYVDDLDAPGERIVVDDPEAQELLKGHPVQLASDVSSATFYTLEQTLDSLEAGGPIELKDRGNGLVTRELVAGCYMRSVERRLEREHAGYPDLRRDLRRMVKPKDAKRFANLYDEGMRPIEPAELGALMVDFYVFAEEVKPELGEFREMGGTDQLDE